MRFRLPLRALTAGLAWLLAGQLQAAVPPLLNAALENWAEGKDDWAFTQRARTFDDSGKLKDERLERYDPSLPDSRRWHLLEFNGLPPTDKQREQCQDRKNRKSRKHANKPIKDILDLENARLVAETPRASIYAIALRPESARLVQVEKLTVEVTVNKEHRTIERVTVGLKEPARVALGLAKIIDVDLDVHFEPSNSSAGTKDDDDVQPKGDAKVTLFKLGDRAEYAWSDFKRVTRYRPSSDSARATSRSSPESSVRPRHAARQSW